ncbi:MAG TPA: adenylate cyclase regulatory domain-containing protein [Acidimicrobiia bacterium]|nr:adenylate cyclase regulatory domain-containing protein [Acidimicrobiia bacterium]
MTDAAELETLGLYDPDAPGAAERLSLLRLALEHGASVHEIRGAIEGARLHALAAERVMLDRPPRLTLADAARAAGVAPDLAARVWRALGFALPAADEAVCTDADVDTLAFFAFVADALGVDGAVSQARVTGAALSRLADSSIQLVRTGVEAPLRQSGAGNVDIASRFVDLASSVVPRIYPMFESVHRRHLVEAARRYALWGVSPSEASTTDAVIGFADLVGYSALNERLSTRELDALVASFEQRVLDAVAGPGARLVKLIGDEAMFVAGTAADAAAVAGQLLAATELPTMRIGLAGGTVLAREGDLFGPVVNLAARLERLAEPGQVLLDADTARGLDPGRVEARGRHTVAGFAEPVAVFALTR